LGIGAFWLGEASIFGIDFPLIEKQAIVAGTRDITTVESISTIADSFKANISFGWRGRVIIMDRVKSQLAALFIIGYANYGGSSALSLGIQVGTFR
jgi:hypothetical protein